MEETIHFVKVPIFIVHVSWPPMSPSSEHPSGAEQANFDKMCSFFFRSSIWFGVSERFFAFSASASPSSTKVLRVLSMVGINTSIASFICASA